MRRQLAFIAVVLATAPPLVHAQQRRGQDNPYAKLLRQYERVHKFRGAILVATGDEVHYRGAVGLANEETHAPNRPETNPARDGRHGLSAQ